MTTNNTTAIAVVLPQTFDERWGRLPGIQVATSASCVVLHGAELSSRRPSDA